MIRYPKNAVANPAKPQTRIAGAIVASPSTSPMRSSIKKSAMNAKNCGNICTRRMTSSPVRRPFQRRRENENAAMADMTSCSDDAISAIRNEFHRNRPKGSVSLLKRSRKFWSVTPSGMMLVFVDS